MTTIERPKTLAEILQSLDAIDQGVMAVTDAERAMIGAALAEKIDSTADVIDQLEHQEERLRSAARKLSDGARQVSARIDRIKEYMAFHMQQTGFNQLPGEVWKAKLQTGLAVEPKREATEEDAAANPEFVRVKYEWNKKELKAALEVLHPKAMEVAELVPSASVSIDVNKGKLLNG